MGSKDFEKWYLSLGDDGRFTKDYLYTTNAGTYFYTATQAMYEQFCEIAKLRAQLSRYREEVQDRYDVTSQCNCGYPSCSTCREAKGLADLLAETPEQSLAAVKAQAVRDADKLEKESKQ